MPENNQASDKTKPEATGSSSTQPGSQAIDMNHTNVIVPHRISNHDKLVQTMVMVDGEWVNVNDTNDQKNVQEDMHKVNRVVTEAQKDIINAQNAADSAVKSADSAISASKVNSDAIAAQGEAISEAKIALDSAAAEIQLTASNAASDAAKIRADVARVQNEVDTAKAANSASVEALKSDISAAKQDLADVHDSLTKAQAAAEESQKTIDNSIAQINSDIEQDRKDIASAQQANADTVKQLDTYSKQAQDQGKTIKSIQDKQDGFTATLADVQGNVTQVSDKVDGLSAGLKDAQDNVASVKAQADQLSATLTDHAKSIATLTASAKDLSSTLEDADGRLSKVEQTAQTNSSTLSDVQGDLSQVKQQADGLVSTLKDAQGDIDQIKQTAKGTAEQLSNAQGDITSLQKDVNGIKLTIADHDKNIHTLQADSKSLHDDMEDAQGNISSLQKTATSLDSEFKDHDGRLSKVEQTASKLTNEFSDEQGHLNRVEQTANGTKQTVANQQGQINSIQTDAAGIHETLTGQGDQIANINVTLNGLNTKYEGVSGDLGKLSDKITTNSTQITQNKQAIALKADQTTVDNLSGEVNQNKAQLKVQADQISSKVSSDDFKTLDNKVGGAITQIQKNSTAIDQTNQQISLKANQTEVDQVKQTATQNSSRLDVMAGEIKSKVTSTDVNNIVDSKGYTTTSTVQSLITQKAGTINESITNLTNSFNSLQVGGRNYLRDSDKSITGWGQDLGTIPNEVLNELAGKTITVSCDVEWSGYAHDNSRQNRLGFEASVTGSDGHNYWFGAWVHPSTDSGKERVSAQYTLPAGVTFAVNNNGHNGYVDINGSGKVSHVKIEVGTKATDWTPASEDMATVTQVQSLTASIDGLQSTVANKADKSQVTQLSNVIQSKVSTTDFNNLRKAVDLQTLESADANNLKTNGHYFVHNLANNPVGGWVYVDVTGNGNDRIRQDVYQDNGNKHKYRRWFGNSWTNWSEGATESEITQLRDDINLRVKSGDLLSQINIEAGRTLIQSNKIYFDADSFVMSPNSKAFIPSAYITDINADKINTGTLHSITINNGNGTFRVDPDGNVYANSMHVNHGSIYQGTVLGADVYSISNLTSNSLDKVNDATQNWVKLKDGIIELHGANGNHYSSIAPIDVITTYSGDGGSTDVHHGLGILDSREVIIGSASLDSEYSNRITHSRNFDLISRTNLRITNSYIQAELDPDVEYGKGARFNIQKDNHIGAYFGQGDNGNQINFNFAGDGCGFNVNGPLHVTGSKNSIVETKQGYLAINAYETAEYYFGDIGESNTGDTSQITIGIDRIFNETVNTDIQYQVFVTPYTDAHVWVEKRYNNRFVVKSDKPNAEFGWELKAKRKGYESNRLRRVDVDFNHA